MGQNVSRALLQSVGCTGLRAGLGCRLEFVGCGLGWTVVCVALLAGLGCGLDWFRLWAVLWAELGWDGLGCGLFWFVPGASLGWPGLWDGLGWAGLCSGLGWAGMQSGLCWALGRAVVWGGGWAAC